MPIPGVVFHRITTNKNETDQLLCRQVNYALIQQALCGVDSIYFMIFWVRINYKPLPTDLISLCSACILYMHASAEHFRRTKHLIWTNAEEGFSLSSSVCPPKMTGILSIHNSLQLLTFTLGILPKDNLNIHYYCFYLPSRWFWVKKAWTALSRLLEKKPSIWNGRSHGTTR